MMEQLLVAMDGMQEALTALQESRLGGERTSQDHSRSLHNLKVSICVPLHPASMPHPSQLCPILLAGSKLCPVKPLDPVGRIRGSRHLLTSTDASISWIQLCLPVMECQHASVCCMPNICLRCGTRVSCKALPVSSCSLLLDKRERLAVYKHSA